MKYSKRAPSVYQLNPEPTDWAGRGMVSSCPCLSSLQHSHPIPYKSHTQSFFFFGSRSVSRFCLPHPLVSNLIPGSLPWVLSAISYLDCVLYLALWLLYSVDRSARVWIAFFTRCSLSLCPSWLHWTQRSSRWSPETISQPRLKSPKPSYLCLTCPLLRW